MSLGIYISVPFCRAKCSYCNFASGVFSAARMDRYVQRIAEDVAGARALAASYGAELPGLADTIYLGGGTPSILEPKQIEDLFRSIHAAFQVTKDAEITIECAPGQISDAMLDLFPRLGVNRVSLGMQSFVDKEARAVGRHHTREVTLQDVERVRRRAGITNINLDLIAGLPHQTQDSWRHSLDEVIATGVPHVSVYMLEVDDDSRLGRELIAGGTRYHAHHVPDDDLVAEMYGIACDRLSAATILQYEISNFARPGQESRHNLKYWTRRPYLGFGLDAHSILPTPGGAVRLATTDDFERFYGGPEHASSEVSAQQALEEEFFLGLRLNRGIDLEALQNQMPIPAAHLENIGVLVAQGLLETVGTCVRLTPRGRLISNDVFATLLVAESASVLP